MSQLSAPEYKQYKTLEPWKPSEKTLSAQELVVKNKEGPISVRYDLLSILLLKELQRISEMYRM